MDSNKLYALILLVLAISVGAIKLPIADEIKLLHNVLPKVPTFSEIAEKNGLQCEEHNVTTSDGYILGVFHIPGDSKKPLLFMHGLLDSSDGMILREEGSLAVLLARAGYDVWVGNNRGNRYSRNHVSLDPNTDDQFWDFTFHEFGTLDLPATIDYILNQTGQSQLSAIGHSEGTTIFYVLGSKRPEYNDKIKVLAALGPIAYLNNVVGLVELIIKFAPEINAVVEAINYQELVGFDSDIKSILRQICSIPNVSYEVCGGVAFAVLGADPAQLEPEFVPILIDHYPAGSSRRNAVHYGQLGNRKEFAEFDYGREMNLFHYNSTEPPAYNLSKVTFDMALFSGANDFLSTLKDVEILKAQLPNVVEHQIIDYPLWTHLDHLYGKLMPQYLFPLLLDLLAKYN
ncbi:lipase 3 [Amyelois transitella]|uniref:lipase 3 n=1 Tax=Amyelois transitella TaxID=680683 RepID=UPI00067C839F|nr:lipase 3 [Amyelois transitella]